MQRTLYLCAPEPVQRAFSGSPLPRWNPKEELEKQELIHAESARLTVVPQS